MRRFQITLSKLSNKSVVSSTHVCLQSQSVCNIVTSYLHNYLILRSHTVYDTTLLHVVIITELCNYNGRID